MAKQDLKKELSKMGLLSISIAGILGSGWLFAPLYASQIAGPAVLIAWVVGILISSIVALTMAEVVTLFPKSGGINGVVALTHGPFLAFFVTGLSFFVYLLLPVIEVRAVLQYAASYYPALSNPQGEPSAIGHLVSFVLLFVVYAVNTYGARVTSIITHSSVLIKAVIPITICVVFLFQLVITGQANYSNLNISQPWSWHDLFLAISTGGIIFSFNGFNQATVFAGEAKNPQKAIPFAIFGSLLFTGLLYLIIQSVFLLAIPASSLTQGWTNLKFPGDSGPFAGIALMLGLHWVLVIIYADAVVSPLGTAFSYASAAPRLIYALGESLPALSFFTRLNRSQVPVVGILISFILGLIALLLLSTFKAILSVLVAIFVLCYTLAPASLLMFRKTHPDQARSFRLPYPWVIGYVSLFLSNLMVLSTGWSSIKYLLLISVPPFVIGALIFFKTRENFVSEMKSSAWFLFEMGALTAIGYALEDHVIPFEVAVGLTALMSGVALGLSQLNVLGRT
jgi:amino acid transporter